MFGSDSDEENEGRQLPGRAAARDSRGDGSACPVSYEHHYAEMDDEVLEGEESDDEDTDFFSFDAPEKSKKKESSREEAEERQAAFLFFDFRLGRGKWPAGAELVTPERAAELIEVATKDAEAEAKRAQEREESKEKAKGSDDKAESKKSWDTGFGGSVSFGGTDFGGGGSSYDPWGSSSLVDSSKSDEDEKAAKECIAPEDSVFETLSDGSTALILPAGKRLKLSLSDLLNGGDEQKEERLKKARKLKKRYGKLYSSWYGGSSEWKSWWKEWVNEYTVTMDIKVLDEDLPREGLSLFQTALVHAGNVQRSGRLRLKQSDGEAIISATGGVGSLGSFGDITKARVKVNRWHRVVVSVKCATDSKQKGEMLTWVDAASGAVIKSEAITANGRFSIDPAAFYLFSSGQSDMMSRTVAIRTIRVTAAASDDSTAKADLARDRVLSMFNIEREREIDAQRQGLSLAPLFAKPRPVWSAPAVVGTFGDPFIEGTMFEGSSCLAWSFQVLILAFKRMLNDGDSIFSSSCAKPTRAALGDIAHILERSSISFKDMARLLKHPNNSQLMSFVRKVIRQLSSLPEGEALLLPGMIEGQEILFLVERNTERSYSLVVINTDPIGGLDYHAVSPAIKPGRLMYRTCLVLSSIPKKNMLDSVFWIAVYNLCISSQSGAGDTHKFYDILLPFITGKPLESSLVDSEVAATSLKGSQGAPGYGQWRSPQRSQTQYVRTLYHAINFILSRRKGISPLRCKQVGLALRLQMVEMIVNDLKFMFPDENGQRVCSMALRQLSHRAIKLSEALSGSSHPDTALVSKSEICSICLADIDGYDREDLGCHHPFHRKCVQDWKIDGGGCPRCLDESPGLGSIETILEKVRNLVFKCSAELETARQEHIPTPPRLDLKLDDSWNGHAIAWNDENDSADPGQAVALQKFVPIDILQLPARVGTRDDAISALRLCDRLCTLIDNQDHCVKNRHLMIASLIEHVLVHIVPIPKPRAVQLDERELQRANKSERRREMDAARKRQLLAKREELRKAKALKRSKFGAEQLQQSTEPSAVDDIPPEVVDASPGLECVEEVTQSSCIWDCEISYELQVEALIVLQRIMEHFTAAVLSQHPCKALDAVRVIVPGCICALSDAIIRRRAYDQPSEACCQLMGQDKSGQQLGLHGFGIDVGSFATQTETTEMHTPELAIARTAILDYFDSPVQRKLEKIFCWDKKFALNPGRALVKYLRMIAREIALPSMNPHGLMCDHLPESSKILKNYPELRCYRDVCFVWKYFLNPDGKAFPNHNNAPNLGRMQTVLAWSWHSEENSYKVDCSAQNNMRCAPNPNVLDPILGRRPKEHELPKHRYPSTATPSFYASPPPICNEDDCIYRPILPSFEDSTAKSSSGSTASVIAAGGLGQRDSELLLSFLTVPYIRLPLVINFFAAEDRVHKLASPKLQAILDAVLFEPGKYLAISATGVEPAMVPTQHSDLLASAYGALLNELFYSPDVTCRSVVALLDAALALDTGSVCDDAATDFNASVTIILFVARLGARVHSYVHFVLAHSQGEHDTVNIPMRQSADSIALETLKRAKDAIGTRLRCQFVGLLNEYLLRLEEQTKASPENEKLINRNSRLACDLHAHRLICFRTCGAGGEVPIEQKSVINLMSSFIYLTTRHSWNKNKREQGRLLVPESELYEILTVQRRRVVNFCGGLNQAALDIVMQSVLETATSLAGAMHVPSDLTEFANSWCKLEGCRSRGRFVIVGSGKNTLSDSMQVRTEIEDTGLQGVEMDLQIGQMTLRAKHLAALESEIANMEHVRELFGEHTIQASLLDRSQHRRRYKLIGLRHEIEYWHEGQSSCPSLGERWERDYDPAELFDSERWIPALFEPIRKSFFDGPMPPAMQFMMVGGPLPDTAEVAVLLGMHQHLGGPFKLVYLFRHYRCVHVYECVSHARQFWYTLHFTSDARYCLRHLQPSTMNRMHPPPAWWKRGAGVPYPKGLSGKLVSNIIAVEGSDCYPSCAIIRDAAHDSNLSHGREYFVPECLLYGIFPEALLDTHRFWMDESPPALGYRRLRGYPKDKSCEYLILVDILQESSRPSHATGRPQRAVRVERRNFVAVQENFKLMQRISAKVESLRLADKPPKPVRAPRATVTQEMRIQTFSLNEEVEVQSTDLVPGLSDNAIVPSQILCDNGNGTYDLEHTGEWAWLGVVKNVPAVQIRLRAKSGKPGHGVWAWEGLSDSEDDAWRSDESSDEEKDNFSGLKEDVNSPVVLTFLQFWDLEEVLSAANWIVEDCEETLIRIAANKLGPFYDMKHLASEVQKHLIADSSKVKENSRFGPNRGPDSEQRMLLLDLMYAPRRSRLFSLAKTLSSIENLSHICVWTRNTALKAGMSYSIDLVDIPRLKLSFTTKRDHEGQLRLFSLDHADLYVSDQHDTFTKALMAGIPYSLLVSNLRGENQLLVPVLPPCRPRITMQPFSTDIVLDRSNRKWMQSLSQHFYLYPIHVSLSFVMAKGLNSSLFLLLLRLLNRDYDSAFRMCDSIATDAKLSSEGTQIFAALSFAADDYHPDAHAVRLKITLVTMESGAHFPWDLTIELALYVAKFPHVSATCLISEQEELQLLSSDMVVLDDQSPKFKAEIHDKYIMTLVKNRLHQLRAMLSPEGGSTAQCFAPSRPPSSGWPWYQDNTVFGERYNEAIDVKTYEDWSTQVVGFGQSEIRTGLSPPGGWLSVVMVHTLWSSASIKLMSRYTELVPVYSFVSFFTLRADIGGLDKIVKDLGVVEFPSFMIMRGGKVLDGALISGQDRTLERLILALTANLTEADRSAHTQYLLRQKEAAGKGAEGEDEEEEEEDAEVLWNWDVDCCGSSIQVHEQGLVAELIVDDGAKSEPIVWEYTRNSPTDFDWKVMPSDILQELERKYMRGFFYQNERLRLGSQFSRGLNLSWSLHSETRALKMENNILDGIIGNWSDSGESLKLRRAGERVHVKGEEKVTTKLQEQLDSRMKVLKEQREVISRRRRAERRGKNVESIRGSAGFTAETGIHRWTLRWNHVPHFAGRGDAVGLVSSHSEVVGPCEPPLMGGKRDGGASIGLYACGQLIHSGNIIKSINPTDIRKLVDAKVVKEATVGLVESAGLSPSNGEGDRETNPERKADMAKGEGDIVCAVNDATQQSKSVDINVSDGDEIRAEISDAMLWSKGSLVTCLFDTDRDGGRLTFEVDGIVLDLELIGVFNLLGGQEVFPSVSLFPIEPESGETGEIQEDAEGASKNAEDLDGEEEEEDEEDRSEAQIIDELAKASNIDSAVIAAMTVAERVDLAASVKRSVEASKVARVTIVFPVPNSDSVKQKSSMVVAPVVNAEGEGKGGAVAEAENESSESEEDEAKKKSPAVDEASQSIDLIRWMWETKSGMWEVYSQEISRELELARRAGQIEHSLRIGESNVVCKIQAGTKMTQQSGGAAQRLRRHCMKEGIEGQWEMMSLVFKPPFSLYGEGALKLFQKVWKSQETMSGKICNLSFLFLYALLQGQIRCKMLPSGYSDWWKSGGFDFGGNDGGRSNAMPSSDSHRLALLLAQLFTDRHAKSVFGSVINVLGRNKQLCVRMPEFRDTRKGRQACVFNGWTDESEPRSPIGELFNKLVPLLQGLKRTKQGSLTFPPKPPHPELPNPPATCPIPCSRTDTFAPKLSDLDCSARTLRPVTAEEVRSLARGVKHYFGPPCEMGEPPLDIEDEIHMEQLVASTPSTLFVIIFHASWCAPCCALAPMVRKIAILTPAARFVRVDVDQCDALATRLLVRSLPTIKFVRGGLSSSNLLSTLSGMNDEFVGNFKSILHEIFTIEEKKRMEVFNKAQEKEFDSKQDELSLTVSDLLEADQEEIYILANRPLSIISSYVEEKSRLERQQKPIGSKLSFDVSKHDAARTAVAQSMLQRMNDDVSAYSEIANDLPTPKLKIMSEDTVRTFFAGNLNAVQHIRDSIDAVENLIVKLQQLRASDQAAVTYSIALVGSCANFVDLSDSGLCSRNQRIVFLLRRAAGQAAESWPEFLFGSLISSKGESDIASLNPYISAERVDSIMQIVMLTMLRANRMGHSSRCLGAAVVMLKLLKQALEESTNDTLLPMILQAADDLADVISSGRHYCKNKSPTDSKKMSILLDPRFLIFEFTWNILLRQKQVEIVHDFVDSLRRGISKVKQMIMGAGKTTVVAPLLALMLADGQSLLLSVVPKALLEMSRTQMRETFANIIPKRVYTFKFERSTEVTPGMRLTLENAARNRGIVVATPTSLKSVMLVYVETIRNLDEAARSGSRSSSERVNLWSRQAKELAGILSLFREGVMLLDEVDLILHPLKSELNFPLGEKHPLDCSDADERWTLPIHMLDAIFYTESRRATAFDARGVALDVLKRISSLLTEGYALKALQRLPHVTLLNPDWYHTQLKPLMAEWVYLWLQKQHLHGISRAEAITYILEGAVARSEATSKLAFIDAALAKVESELGVRPPVSPAALTPAHLASLGKEERLCFEEESQHARTEMALSLELHPERRSILELERTELEEARQAAHQLQELVHQLYLLDEQVELASQASGKRLAELQEEILRLQKEIQDLESPRDDSFDNSIILWASDIFTKITSGELSRVGDEGLVSMACGKLEALGFTVRRCGTFEEAVDRAWQLRASGQLRCIIAGGEAVQGCARGCNRSHDGDGNCLVCGFTWAQHSGHNCPRTGSVGSWLVNGRPTGAKGMDHPKLLKSILEEVPPNMSPIPPERVILFSGGSAKLREDRRLALWRQGVTVTEDRATLLEWAEAHGPWLVEDGEEEGGQPDPPTLKRETSSGIRTLKNLRQRLIELQKMKEQAHMEVDKQLAAHRQTVVAKQAQLESCIQKQIDYLLCEVSWAQEIFNVLDLGEITSSCVGPSNGKDAALAVAFLKSNMPMKGKKDTDLDSTTKIKFRWALRSVALEHKWLLQAALAAKVMAHVTSPTQKKLLNLSYDWLRTFLPHVLAKVNRVSYGLLSSADCAAAIETAPNVPRSRLKLCVPFVGKDVASKSSEFAHPDVIIGLTILAYRYSGMRPEDFVDLVDSLTSEFVQEIGPARDRPASRRHESWVLAAGGKIRGVLAIGNEPGGIEDSLTEKAPPVEVVQLKFLQKSNDEQMEKLYNLWRSEPMAIHHYLTKFIFPAYMLSQKVKLSASGQAVGGDMLVGRRAGFSGTPSDLLPKELGRCDYAVGDDGKMLSTMLDPAVASHELLPVDWSVQAILLRVATSVAPRYHALIDTGALITGYSNQEVAVSLLAQGLEWCDGVVFLNDNDEKQVLVRATGRAVPADQCGVPLDRRFAFYDQIHTTGMDIKHVVNAVAVMTLGKDMVFRDYVQGAYRMRGIGVGQRVHLFLIPEVHDLILRELRAAGDACAEMAFECKDGSGPRMLESVVSWLVINSMRTEQTQWSMLCLQNVSNIYRKNAFARLLASGGSFEEQPASVSGAATIPSVGSLSVVHPSVTRRPIHDSAVMALPLQRSLKVFDETLDFSLEAAVPDSVPFETKLRDMLTSHDDFILSPDQHAVGHHLLTEVAAFSLVSEGGNLDTEQEREQEQEQEKEVKARRDQQVEVEKFVEREYSRHKERPRPWPVSMLGCDVVAGDNHPFYVLEDFKMLLHSSLPFPPSMLLSRNYYNPAWTGLRRLKNVVIIMEWAPSTGPSQLALVSDAEHEAAAHLDERQLAALKRAHELLAFHKGGPSGGLSREGLADAVRAALWHAGDPALVDSLAQEFGCHGGVTAEGLKNLLTRGRLRQEHRGRYWVAVSLAEAETLRRVLHIRRTRAVVSRCSSKGGDTEVALHLSQPAASVPMTHQTTLTTVMGGNSCGALAVLAPLDASRGWRGEAGSGATTHEAAMALGCFRFFDCDMHFSLPALARLVRALQRASPHDREQFFLATISARRRMERKWQETPLAAVFSVEDEWVALKQRAQAAFVREALRARGVTSWEAFVAFDADNNARLSPSELYGALRWLRVPGLTAEDVVDFFELADRNRDGMIDYHEYMELFEDEEEQVANGFDEGGNGLAGEPLAKVEPFGADELREIMVARRRRELDRQLVEQARRAVQHAEADLRLYREELQASARRQGGSNPAIYLRPVHSAVLNEYSGGGVDGLQRLVVFSFFANRHPLRTQVSGKNKYLPIFIDEARKRLAAPLCSAGHPLQRGNRYTKCRLCSKQGLVTRGCLGCYYWICPRCVNTHEEEQVRERSDPAGKHTYLECEAGSDITLQVPPPAVDTLEGDIVGTLVRSWGDEFAVTVELKMPALPPRGQLAVLLRLNPPDLSQARRRHVASLYVDSDGALRHSSDPSAPPMQQPLSVDGAAPHPTAVPVDSTQAVPAAAAATTAAKGEAKPAASKAKPARANAGPPRIREGRWTVLTLSVNSSAGRLVAYIDGRTAAEESGLDPSSLRLGARLIVLGGGKAAQSRGGAVRRILVHDLPLDAAAALATYTACAGSNPATGGRLLRAQAAWRGRRIRLALEREGIPIRTALGTKRGGGATAKTAKAAPVR